mgnify:CR=1 FL=1
MPFFGLKTVLLHRFNGKVARVVEEARLESV